MSEFNLSERIKLAKNQEPNETWYHEAIIIEDVKEFIKRLKANIYKIDGKTALGRNRLPGIMMVEFEAIIDNLAGEKLTAQEESE